MADGIKAGAAFLDVDALLDKFRKTLDEEVPKEAAKAGDKASKALGSRLGGVGHHLKEGVTESLSELSGISLGAGITGIGAGLDALAAPAERAKKQLEAAFAAAGVPIEKYQDEISKTEHEMENFGHTNADTDDALRKLTSAFQDPKKALHEMGLVANLAAAQHISLAKAADQDVKMHAGATKTFKQFGISVSLVKNPLKQVETAQKNVTKAQDAYQKALTHLQQLQLVDHSKKKLTVSDYIALKNAQDKVDGSARTYYGSLVDLQKAHTAAAKDTHTLDDAFAKLSHRVKGQAAAAVDSFSGRLEVWKTKIQDVAAVWGAKLGPILTTAGPILAGLGGILSSGLIPALHGTAEATDEVAVSEGLAIGWIVLIVAAIAALVAGVIYAYTHFQTFRDVIDAVGTWFRDTLWPILQTVAADIVIAFQQIWQFAQAAWNTVGHPLFDIIVQIIKVNVAIWVGVFDIAKNAFVALWQLASWIWTNIGHPIFTAVVVAANGLRVGFQVAFSIAQAIWSGLWRAVSAIWNSPIGHAVFALVVAAANGVKNGFEAIKGPIIAVWNAIGSVLRGFVHTFIQPILDGITAAKNSVGFFTGGRNDVQAGIDAWNKAHPNNKVNIPSHDKGGYVEGRLGSPQLIVAHGGEYVNTVAESQRGVRGPGGVRNYYMTTGTTIDQVHAAEAREERLLAYV